MLILKQTPTERIVMYGSDSREHLYFLGLLEKKIGSKSQLGTKTAFAFNNNDFWKDLVEPFNAPFECYKYYDESDPEGWMYFCTAKESGHSALSQVKGEYILIVRDVLK